MNIPMVGSAIVTTLVALAWSVIHRRMADRRDRKAERQRLQRDPLPPTPKPKTSRPVAPELLVAAAGVAYLAMRREKGLSLGAAAKAGPTRTATCTYCRSAVSIHETHCSSCGAPMIKEKKKV